MNNQGANYLQTSMDNTTSDNAPSAPDDEYLFKVSDNKGHTYVNVLMDDQPVRCVVDSGATCNIVDRKTYQQNFSSAKLFNTSTNIFTYGSNQPLQLEGIFYPVICLSV